MYACYCRAVILCLTFHQSPTEVGAGAISDGLYEQLRLILVCLSHASEAKLQCHPRVIGHQTETITLLHCTA